MSERPKIMYESDEAAQKVTVTGWRSRNGHFYGDNEHLARWDGCTHQLCDCGAEMDRGYTICSACRDKKRLEQYEAMPFKEWDGIAPLTLHDDDEYFWDEDGLLEYCEMNGMKPEDLRLVICEPQYASEVEPDEYLCDILPEDQYVADIYPELADAFENLNKLIREQAKPISWTGGKCRTAVRAKQKAA
jgi:hypothetical protein